MTTLIIIIAVLTLILGILEIFVIPGFGFAGIGAIACALLDTTLIYYQFGPTWAVVTIIFTIIVFGLMIAWVAHSKTFDKMALHTAINSTNATSEQLSVQVGDEGKALTRLALVGNAQINGKMVEVKSSGAFINPGTPVRVTHVSEANITVEAIA